VALFASVGAGHAVTSSIVLERLLGMTSIVIVSVIGVSLLPATLFGLDSSISIFVAAFITIAILIGFLQADRILGLVSHWIPKRWPRLTTMLQQLAAAFAEYRPKRGLLAWSLILSIGIQITRTSATWLIAVAVHDATPYWAFLLFVPYLYIVNLIPVATSRFGLEQGAFIVLFGAVGMPAETALTISLLAVFATLLIALPGGLWLLTDRPGRKGSTARATVDAASRVIVHADDFGETEEITRGIVAGIEGGVVTSSSILANMPATALAIAEARRLADRASFGVHLNLWEGCPLTAAASLTGADGRFAGKSSLVANAFIGRLDIAEVKRELAAQIEVVRQGGVKISHLDSHKHLHQLPGVSQAVAELAAEQGIERVRCTIEDEWWQDGLGVRLGLSRLVRLWLAGRLAHRLDETGVRYPARTFDLAHLMRLGPGARRELMRRPGLVTEMFCHPGTPESDREKPISCDRAGELRFLTSPDFAALCRDAGAELVTYWAV
jgi:predicted glycoside hydrolase/deacetylase ChbG (UPF0249 family)